MTAHADVAVIGAGAAGLMAAICAARADSSLHVVALDGARKLGAKILVAGGGRCNVTHDVIDESAYAGASRNAIKKVLRRFDVPQTVAFFREIGVELKRESTGKLFPVTDDAHTVLNALLDAAHQAGVSLQHPRRVESLARDGDGFMIRGAWGELAARRVILATGGRALPKSGSDGQGYTLAQALGHTLTPRIFPALVPLTLPRDHWITALSGVAVDAALDLRAGTGKRLQRFENALLCTHFGISGPLALDMSRYYLDARADDPAAALTVHWIPALTAEQIDSALQAQGKASPLRYLTAHLPERLARAVCVQAGIEPTAPASALTREQRRALVTLVMATPLPITGDRGFTYAEVTAGGVPVDELHLKTLESRVCAGLHLCGEICDVDGRIGGYNFQWAWSSGYVAGISAVEALRYTP